AQEGAYDGHHRTAGIAGRTRRRGGRVAARGEGAAAGDTGRRRSVILFFVPVFEGDNRNEEITNVRRASRSGRYNRRNQNRAAAVRRRSPERTGNTGPAAILGGTGERPVSAEREKDPCWCVAGEAGQVAAAWGGRLPPRQA